jgi:hypothetical protein
MEFKVCYVPFSGFANVSRLLRAVGRVRGSNDQTTCYRTSTKRRSCTSPVKGRREQMEEKKGVSDQVFCNEVGLLDQVKLRALTGSLRSIYSTIELV